MKSSIGEVVALKGNGFSWTKPLTGFIDVLISDFSVGITHGPQNIMFSDLSVGVIHGGSGVTLVDLSTIVVVGPTPSHIVLADVSAIVTHSGA